MVSVSDDVAPTAPAPGRHKPLLGKLRHSVKVAGLLAWNDIDGRYRRTTLGPLWIVASHAIWIGAIYLLQSGLFGANPSVMLPYLACGVTLWNVLAASISGGAGVFMRSAGQIGSFSFPLYVYALRSQFATFIVLAHQMVLTIGILAYFGYVPRMDYVMFGAAMCLYLVFGVSLSIIFGFLGARFRDVQHILDSLLTLMFLLTPIFWQRTLLVRHHWIVDYNPLAQLLEIARGPLMGKPVDPYAWGVSLGVTAFTAAVAVACYNFGKKRVYFWIQ
jgi:ABC-type polysaccharide/polyol phosphate export permease